MSENDSPAVSEAGKLASGGKPSLFERLRSLFGLGEASVREDIEVALAEAETEGGISPQERALLKNVLNLHEVYVGDVMVPRAEIAAVPLDATLGEVLDVFREVGHSRLPVHGGTLDDPRGMVHIRDFVAYLAAELLPRREAAAAGSQKPAEEPADAAGGPLSCGLEAPLSEAKVLRPVLYVPPSMPALDLLVKMQATRTHMALVIDEYGGTEGLASIEDIVELIVGDIEDEHDTGERPRIEASAGGEFLVDGRADLAEVSSTIGADLTAISDAEDVDTLGGLIITLAGHVPARGEVVTDGGIEFEVVDADQRRVKRARIRKAGLRPQPILKENPGPPA